ncbi:hypothetical protein [Bradyrhizobium sp. CCBAU 21359]|uniref:hypothetical protein n=1 Tax=Bradyrhizobium sp. CCBAU 21359 TaxID=1325080 RepID=UPI0023066AFF|nr:hypothetical protein [Bradyrhizobium sp. CCBAU 21359]
MAELLDHERADLTISLKEFAKRYRIEHLLGQNSVLLPQFLQPPSPLARRCRRNYHDDLLIYETLLASSVRPFCGRDSNSEKLPVTDHDMQSSRRRQLPGLVIDPNETRMAGTNDDGI